MKFTETNIDYDSTAKIPAESSAARGYITLEQLLAAANITDALQGAAADPTRIGAEYLPDALSFAGEDPNLAVRIITGELVDGVPIVFEELVFGPTGSPYLQTWANAALWADATQAYAIVSADGLDRFIASGAAQWTSTDGGLTWAPMDTETGTPLVSEVPLAASHIGQLCQTPTAWYRWTGTVWQEAASVSSAAEVAFTPAGNIAATDVQAALVELDAEKLSTVAAADITDAGATGILSMQAGTPAEGREAIGAPSAAEAAAFVDSLRDRTTLLENPVCLARVHDKIQGLDQKTVGYRVGMTAFGDSVAGGYQIGYIFNDLAEQFGLGGVFSPGFGNSYSGSPGWALAGGATRASTDYTYSPNSNHLTIPVGGSASYTLDPMIEGDVPFMGSSDSIEGKIDPSKSTIQMRDGVAEVIVYVIKEPGAGTITATLSQSGYADVIGVLDADAADGLGTIQLTPHNRAGSMTIVLTSATATVKAFGVGFFADAGFFFVRSNVGGSTMDQQKTCLTGGSFKPAYAELLAELNVSVVLHHQRVPGDANWETNYPIFFDAYEELKFSQIVLSEPPLAAENSPTTQELKAFLRPECAARGIGFFDQQTLVTPALLQELGWDTGDVAHNLNDANRYFASKFLDAVGRFRTAWGAFGNGGISRSNLADERFRLFALNQVRTTQIIGRNGILAEAATTSGGYTHSVTSERGFRFLSAAALGGSAARIGIMMAGSSTVPTQAYPISVTAKGYRNVNIKAGVRGFLAFGGSATNIATLTGLSQKCYGVEFALGSDVGSPDGSVGEVGRIFACNGVTTENSHWFMLAKPGEGLISNLGWGFMLRWDPDIKTFFLSEATNNSSTLGSQMATRMALYAPAFHAASNTSGVWVHAGIYAEDAGNVPATNGEISWRDVTATWGNLNNPYRVK